ncbi:MAG: sugar phosphate isomerase/epimerase family protein, partial [Phycisphaerae bacterium]
GKPSTLEGDPRAVRIIREIAGMAQQSGLRVALYPHTGDWLERVEDAVRVARKADRKNVGVMFNLCHWLKVADEKDPEPALKLAMPRLFAVTVNGADSVTGPAGWDRLIQPLGRGSFDMLGFLKTLKRMGYAGPIGLQCYGIQGDAREHLAGSMAAWRKLSAKIAAEQQ